jgi:hypothetical protein
MSFLTPRFSRLQARREEAEARVDGMRARAAMTPLHVLQYRCEKRTIQNYWRVPAEKQVGGEANGVLVDVPDSGIALQVGRGSGWEPRVPDHVDRHFLPPPT